jgi:AcrR family transcriptional regulator
VTHSESMGSQAAGPPERGSPEIKGLPRDVFAPSERERLVQAMATVCAERGYAEVTVEEVVERAGVSRRAFDESFADKEECGLAAVNQILAESTAVASAAWSADTSEWESVLRGVRALLELLAARPSFAYMAFIGSRQMMPDSASALYQSGFQVLASMIDRLRADSPKEARQPSTAARGALGSGEILIRREIAAGRSERLPELLPDIIYGALVPYLDQHEALRYAGLARELLNHGG